MYVLFTWVLLFGQFCVQRFMVWQTAHFVGIPCPPRGFLLWGFVECFGVDRRFWCTLFSLEGLLRTALCFCCYSMCFFSGMQGLSWLFVSCFIFYKDFFLVLTNSSIVKVVLCLVRWLLLDVTLFKICSGNFIVFRKYFDQLGFSNVVTQFFDGSFFRR